MDIHKPKAAHNWREFAVEIGTIICGILIALGLEQAVEFSRSQHELGEARKAIAAQLSFDAGRLQWNAAEDVCADQRLQLLDAWAAGTVRLQSANLASLDNRPLLGSLRSSAWEVAKTGAIAARMPVAERLALADVYDEMANEAVASQDERRAWIALGRFAGKGPVGRGRHRRAAGDGRPGPGERFRAPAIRASHSAKDRKVGRQDPACWPPRGAHRQPALRSAEVGPAHGHP